MNDFEIAKKYINKANSAKSKGTKFSLTFYEYKRIITAKYCKYTGVELTHQTGKIQTDTDITIDRIDNSLGYVTGNVAACCTAYNSLKSMIENPINSLTFENTLRALKAQRELTKGSKQNEKQ